VTNPIRSFLSDKLSRRGFLSSAAATGVSSTAVAAAAMDEPGSSPEIIPIGPPERPLTDIEAWNVGLISASRPELSRAENHARNLGLLVELARFGRYRVRGRYIENFGQPHARAIEAHAILVIGDDDDSGNLKGFLRKAGRKYEQDAIIHKGYYRDAELHALRDLPDLRLSDKERKNLGHFSPDLLPFYYALIMFRSRIQLPTELAHVEAVSDGIDWLGGRWEDIGYWTIPSFFARVERRVRFAASGQTLKD
jgi:hypothetical protein